MVCANIDRVSDETEVEKTLFQFFLYVIGNGRVNRKGDVRIAFLEGCYALGQIFHIGRFACADRNIFCHIHISMSHFFYGLTRKLYDFLGPAA